MSYLPCYIGVFFKYLIICCIWKKGSIGNIPMHIHVYVVNTLTTFLTAGVWDLLMCLNLETNIWITRA